MQAREYAVYAEGCVLVGVGVWVVSKARGSSLYVKLQGEAAFWSSEGVGRFGWFWGGYVDREDGLVC